MIKQKECMHDKKKGLFREGGVTLKTKYKRKYILYIFPAVFVIVCVLYYLYSERKADLIITPSTHEEIVWLAIENKETASSDYNVEFCLFDRDCNYIQICFQVPSDSQELLKSGALDICVDDSKISEYSIATRTYWVRSYVMVLLDNIMEVQTVECKYGENVFEAYYQAE